MFASEAAVAANRVQSKFVVATDVTMADGTAVTGYEASIASVTGGVVTPPTPDGTGLVVALAADTPVAGSVIIGRHS